MIELYYVLVFSTITGTAAYLIWLVATSRLEGKNRLSCIYPMTVLVMVFYLVPCIYLWTGLLFSAYKRNLGFGVLPLWTPFIMTGREWVACIWLLGAVGQTILQIRRRIGMVRHLDNNIYEAQFDIVEWKDRIAAELGLHSRVDVYKSLVLTSPVVVGVFRKKILLPDRKYEEQELEAILYHELVHIKQGILLIKSMIVMLQIVQWFNPFVYSLLSSLDEWAEISCDLYVHFNTKCTLTFREYFDVVLDGVEYEQAVMPSSMTQLRKKKGVAKRVDKVKKYKREKDFKLKGSLFTLAAFVAMSTSTAWAAEVGMEKAHEALYELTDEENVLGLSDDGDSVEKEYEVEYAGTFDIDEETMVEMPSFERGGDSFTFESSVPAGKLGYTKLFKVYEGGKIAVTVTADSDDVTLKVGIINPDGSKVCVTGSGLISYTFDADTTGSYRVYVDNESNTSVWVDGYVAYHY